MVGLLGAGGQARETAQYVAQNGELVEFWSTPEQYKPESVEIAFVEIENAASDHADAPVVCAVGAPLTKRLLVEQWPGDNFTSVISVHSVVGEDTVIGRGVTVAPGVTVTTGVHIGAHVLVNVGATLSHDVVIGDFCTIGPGVHIGGNVIIGQGVVIGVGASIVHGVTIGDNTYIGAGTVVTDDIPSNVVAVGVPARVVKSRKGWISEL